MISPYSAAPQTVSQEVALPAHTQLTMTGMIIAEDTTPDEIQAAAAAFGTLKSLTGFAVGDLGCFYREHYPERFQDWVASYPVETKSGTELDQKTIKVYTAVAAFYPHDVRQRYLIQYEGRRALTFSHFSRVRRFGMEQALYWLERAATEDLSVTAFDELVGGGVTVQDDHPDVPEVPDSQFGFIYDLGHGHRLLCGDSTDAQHVAALFQTANPDGTVTHEKASLIWTDPPYGVDYVGKSEKAGSQAMTIQNDGQKGLLSLLVDAWAAAAPNLIPSCPFYVAGPTGDNAEAFIASFRETARDPDGTINPDRVWRYKQMLVWVKNTIVLGRQDHQLQHEGIFYGNAPGPPAGRRPGEAKADILWYGGDNQSSVFNVPKPAASLDHPTMKPTLLIEMNLKNSSRPGEIILDLFAGSGSTVIAAEQTGRRAFVVEFDPRYADVIRTRVAKFYEDAEELQLRAKTEQQAAPTQPDDSMPEN
jgi:DNA modification methylase